MTADSTGFIVNRRNRNDAPPVDVKNGGNTLIIIFIKELIRMQTVKSSAAKMPENKAEPLKLLKRIGSSNVEVIVRFSETGSDTMADIVRRLIEREVDRIA